MCGHAARVGVERAAHVHGEVLREIVGVGFREARPADDAGVVDQDVDAPELLDRVVDERLRARRRSRRRWCRRSRRRPRRRSRPRPSTRARRRPRRPRIEPPRSLTTTRAPALGEQECVGPADAASRAGDDRDASLEAVLAHPQPLVSRVPTSPLYCRGLDAAHAAAERRARTQREVEGAARHRSSTRRRPCSRGRATTPPASPSSARSTVSARARSTTTSTRRKSSSPPSTIV